MSKACQLARASTISTTMHVVTAQAVSAHMVGLVGA